jgi:predicted DNA-binding transcriptional regulator YafY
MEKGPDNTGSNVADPEIDPAVLATIAACIRDEHYLRFDYAVAAGSPTRGAGSGVVQDLPILVEPYRLVSWQRYWYLVARDEQSVWRTYRVDWITLRMATGRKYQPRPIADEDYTDFVLRDVATTGWKVHARITVDAPAQEVLSRIHAAVGIVESIDDNTCVLVTGADSLEIVAVYIGMLGLDFHVDGPPELLTHLQTIGNRYLNAIPRSPAQRSSLG